VRTLRLHRIPFSTNVERVALAAAHKGFDVEWVDHDPEDRSEVRAISGQDLVPVLELDGEVVVDSMRIVERLEALAPDPPLYPADRAARARVDLFVEWFEGVWKRPPNEIDDELARRAPDEARIAALSARMTASLDLFEGLLADFDHLLSDGLGAADVCAFPFLKYAVLSPDPGDDEPFHYVLSEHLPLGDGFPRLRAWIARVDARPRG
jgi:glutathione S-transferase